MLLAVTSRTGVDLDVFDCDYEMTWAALCLSPAGGTLGRYGTQNNERSPKHRSLAGLRYAMERALARHRTTLDREITPDEIVNQDRRVPDVEGCKPILDR